jgi:hypothetical protein
MKRSHHKGLLVFLLMGFSILFLVSMAEAATFCVTDSEDLQAKLTAAEANTEDDFIQIVEGTYNGNFSYNSSETYTLTIIGGYSSGCLTPSGGNTILNGEGSGTVLNVVGGNLVIDGLVIQNGSASGLVANTSGSILLRNSILRYNSGSNGGGAKLNARVIELDNNAFLFNTAGVGGAVDIQGGGESINFYNNLITHNSSNNAEGGGVHIKWTGAVVTFINNVITKNATTRYIGGGHGGGAHISTYGGVNFINNTVVGNTANVVCCWGGGITIYYAAYANVYNNIFWDNVSNPGRDIAFYSISQDNLNLFNNYIDQSTSGVSGLTDFVFDISNLDAVNPLFFDPMNEDYHLQSASPCLNVGTNDAPELPTTDKDGQPRIYPLINGIVDMGAYEYQGAYGPTAPDLFGGLKEFHYYKLDEKIVVEVWVKNRGTNSGEFKVAFYLSDNGVTLGQLIDEDTVKKGLKAEHNKNVSCKYFSPSSLSGKYIIAVIDPEEQVPEMVETNNRVRARIP